MLTIRLQRTGSRNNPSFRIVLAQSYRAASKKAIEVLGHYNPLNKDFAIKDSDRVKKLLDQNTQLSPTVHNLFVEKKLVTTPKVKAWQPKKKEGQTPAPAPQAQATPAPAPEKPAETPVETPAEPAAVEPTA